MIQCAPAGEQYRTVYAAADDDLGARLAWHDSRAHPALAVPVAGVNLDGSIEAVVTHGPRPARHAAALVRALPRPRRLL